MSFKYPDIEVPDPSIWTDVIIEGSGGYRIVPWRVGQAGMHVATMKAIALADTQEEAAEIAKEIRDRMKIERRLRGIR